MAKTIFITIVMLLLFTQLKAQDIQFSQYYKAPLYLNPAFAGATKEHRLVLNYRNQWPSIPKAFSSYAFSYDVRIDKYNSGFGLLINTDRAGTAGFRANNIGLIYANKIRIGSWVLNQGIIFSYGVRDLDFQRLVFGDQLEYNGPTTDDAIRRYNAAQYFDFGAGIMMHNKTSWFGYSVHHLNEPNFTLLDTESTVPMRHSIHAGFRMPLYSGLMKKDRVASLGPSIILKKQGQFTQIDLGSYLYYDPVTFGLWYRGIPLQQNVPGYSDHDAIVAVIGIKHKSIEIGYSYDVTISGLGTATGGAHEVSLTYLIPKNNTSRPKPQKFIPCPTFYDHGLF